MEKLSYIAHRRAKFNSISGVVNIPWGTGLEAVDGFIWWGNKCLCATKSETAHLFFAINEDGHGLERGAATVAIINPLAKPGMDHQKRWDKVWADRTAKKYKRRDHLDYWLWSDEFFKAPIEDLRHIATLVGAKLEVRA